MIASRSPLDSFAQTIWPKPSDLPIVQNCTVVIAGRMTARPDHSLPPMSEVANLAAQSDSHHAAVRFYPGGDRRRVRAYVWAIDGSDSATYELNGDDQAVRTGEAPPPLPVADPPLHQETTLGEFVALILSGRPEVLAMNLPMVCYLTANRHNIMYTSKIDFSKGEPPYVSRFTIEKESGVPIGVCHTEDTQSGRAFRYTRPMKKRLLRSPVPVGSWSQPTEVPSILEELRATMSK